MDATYLQRLSFIKYLFSIALYQSSQPEPLYGVSILSFHDSVELFLQLSLQKLNISKDSKGFIDYWEVIDKVKGVKLSQKESMKRLNKARVSLKHHGIFPSKLDIESYRATTLAFFSENCPIIFNIEFDNVSLIDCITYEKSRELLREAMNDFGKGFADEALKKTALSFIRLISDYEKSKIVRYKSPFVIGKKINFRSVDWLGRNSESRKFNNFLKDIKYSIDAIQQVLRILCFGIDFKKYSKFKAIVPPVEFAMDGTIYYGYIGDRLPLKKEDFDFCVSFIVESAMKLQDFEFEGSA